MLCLVIGFIILLEILCLLYTEKDTLDIYFILIATVSMLASLMAVRWIFFKILKIAKEKKVGARALRAVIEEFMLDIMYEIPKDDNIGQVTITKDYIEGVGAPLITMRGQKRITG